MENYRLDHKINTKEIVPGRFFKICYETYLPTTKLGKENKVEVKKVTTRITRSGVNYTHLKRYTPPTSAPDSAPRVDWGKYVRPNMVKVHKDTGKWYLTLATMEKGQHITSNYYIKINGKPVVMSEQELKDSGYIPASYWSGASPVMLNIAVSNIRTINGRY